LGFELPEDEDLLHIAKEGLKAPLPEPWKACQTKDGEIYYFHPKTGESTWDHPLDEFYKKKYQEAKKNKKVNQFTSHKRGLVDTKNIELSPEYKKNNENQVDEKNYSNLLDKLSPITGGGESNSNR
jgi:hypothetical protein